MVIYRVKEGDTLEGIARAHGVLPTALAEANGLTADQPPAVGRALVIRVPGRVYHAREGDTTASIARRHRTTRARLLQLNPALAELREPYPGMTLTVAPGETPCGAISVVGFADAATPGEELSRYLPYLSYLAIGEGRIGEGGSITLPEDAAILERTRSAGVVPLLTVTAGERDGREAERQRTVAALSPEGREALVEALVPLLKKRGYGGLLLDLSPEVGDTEAMTALLVRLRHRLGHTAAVFSTLPIAAAEDPLSCRALGRAAGALLAETHTFSSRFSPPSPASPLDRVEEAVRPAAREIRPEKLLLTLSTRAVDYPIGGGMGRVLPATEAEALSAEGRLGFDPIGQVPYLARRGGEGERVLFFEDAESFREKLLLLDRLHLGGVALHPLVGCSVPLLLMLAEMFRIVKPFGE